jgi:tetratricopeptide (TPR) repeat protein
VRQFVGRGADPATPRGQAEGLLTRAFEENDSHRRANLARQALAVWPDCADAYVLLAEDARSRKEALALYRQGVEAGERALGPDAFRLDAGRFWGVVETRPYMRARLGLAHALWAAGRRPEAVGHLWEMLRLNPNDNQGVRHALAGFLLALDRDDDLARLLHQYADEGSAAWAYTRALLAFRLNGDTPEARRLLEEAKEANRHVPDYILDRKFPPPERPGSYNPGDDSEALHYIGSCLAGWVATLGAVAWLRANDEQTRRRKARTPRPRGPLSFVKKGLREKLPLEDDVWQAGCRRLPNPVRIAGEKVRLWLVLVTSRTHDLILAHQVLEEEPAAAAVWDTLVQAMQNPPAGEPHRPAEVQVRAGGVWESLRPHAEEVGIDLVVAEGLDHFDSVFAGASEHIAGKPQPGLLDMPDVGPEQVAGFYQAAASFFEQAPWRRVGYKAAVRVECGKYQSGPWYAMVMGQSGLSLGLTLYEDPEAVRRVWERPDAFEENLRESVATAVIFGEEIDLPLADVEGAERHGWAVARDDAWPLVLHKERGLSHRPPLAWELELLEGCLRAVPDFVGHREEDDPAGEEFTVPAASGQLRLVLAWVVEGEAGSSH